MSKGFSAAYPPERVHGNTRALTHELQDRIAPEATRATSLTFTDRFGVQDTDDHLNDDVRDFGI